MVSNPTLCDPTVQAAREALRSHDYAEAVRRFSEHLENHPDDLEVRLELGIARLMAGDGDGFYEVHDELEPVMERSGRLTGRLARLWEIYCSLIQKAARAAAVFGMAVLPLGAVGCVVEKPPPSAPANPPPAVVQPPPPAPPPAAPDAAAPPPMAQVDAAAAPPGPPPAPKYGVVRPRPPIRLKYGIRRPIRPKYKAMPPSP